MAQKKETKKIKARDLKPKKDAKGGGHIVLGQRKEGPGLPGDRPGRNDRPGRGDT